MNGCPPIGAGVYFNQCLGAVLQIFCIVFVTTQEEGAKEQRYRL